MKKASWGPGPMAIALTRAISWVAIGWAAVGWALAGSGAGVAHAESPHAIDPPRAVETRIDRLDPSLDHILAKDAKIEQVAEGFAFLEGPVWMPGGYLLFSDIPNNVIYRWTPPGKIELFRSDAGYSGADIGEYKEPGSNGLTVDRQGRLTINELGNRRVTRLEANGKVTVMAERYQGKRLSSPNDLVYRSDGTLFFTDPPFGMPGYHDDPRMELPFSGVFRVGDRRLHLLTRDLPGPNGLAFSPDEKHLYVANWNPNLRVLMRYDVSAEGDLSAGRVFFDFADAPEKDQAPDGMKVDNEGNVYVAAPGGVWIISPQGRHLGTIRGPELPANMAWGESDGKTLYLTARHGLYRIRLNVPGPLPAGKG